MYSIIHVIYQETPDGPKKPGLLIDEGSGPVLDTKGHPVGEVWDYWRRDDLLSLNVAHLFVKEEV